MNFKQFMENDALQQSHDRILQYYIDSTNLRDFIPGKHREGSLGDIEDLKAVLWSTLHNFPANGKSVCVISRVINHTVEGINLMGFAHFLENQKKLKIFHHKHQDLIIGKPDLVDEISSLKDTENYSSDDYHTKFGELLGYSPDAIQNFLRKYKAYQSSRSNLSQTSL